MEPSLQISKLSLFSEFIDHPTSDYYFNEFVNLPSLSQGSVTLFGKEYLTPRLESLHGEQGLSYSYSNQVIHAEPFTPGLSAIRAKIKAFTGISFNCVLVNLYRNGLDSNGWHADDEKELGQDPIIASLSFGSTRKFKIRNNQTKEIHTIPLKNGDLVIMGPGFQREFKHCIPKEPKITEARINLTFRNMQHA